MIDGNWKHESVSHIVYWPCRAGTQQNIRSYRSLPLMVRIVPITLTACMVRIKLKFLTT